MATQTKVPYAAQDPQEVATLVKGLEASTKKHGGGKATARKHAFKVAGTDGVTVDSWQFRDWDYKRRDLPTYARGLFTYRRKDGTFEIATRGYDKFFNVGEVHETAWENVESMTQGPYELSVKENGCIIFISGLEGDKLLVCSKHSTGARADVEVSHAVAGEQWVDKHLSAIGRTRADLAKDLRERNATAIAELCDDAFEEHVLAYEPKDAGLYLHGINLNLPGFATYSGEQVHQFADEWGFKKAQYLILDDIGPMQKFLSECAETGSYAGRDTEGFVIRCRRKVSGTGVNYQDWFFKYKFEEPYLMYRQWREATKAIISGKSPRFKKHKEITEQYLQYARRQLAKDPSIVKAYKQNHGIIAMRNGFLAEVGRKGSDITRQEEEEASGESSSDAVTRDLILLPVASIGCGKTTVAIALTKLFGWGHVQNDNIMGKNRPKQFCNLITNTLAAHPAMIADRNNHQKRERKQVMDDVLEIVPGARFVALHYVHDPKPKMLPNIRQVAQSRIFARGDNHQTIRAGSKSRSEIIAIMEGFLDRFEPVNIYAAPDDGFDEVINLDVTASSRENLEMVVSALHKKYPKLVPKMPNNEELDKAIEAALSDYKPDVKHDLSFKSNKRDRAGHANGTGVQPSQPKAPKLEYFCIKLPTNDVLSTLDKLFNRESLETTRIYHQFQQSRRIQPAFHVTLMHRASLASHSVLWSHLTDLRAKALSDASQNLSTQTSDPLLGECRVRLERVVWDDRVMCIVVRLLDEGWETANPIAHITVGTAHPDIKPKESNDLLQRWMESGSQTGIADFEIAGHVEVPGEVRAVMQGR